MSSCIIIEDEPLALIRTQKFAQRTPFLEVIAVFDNALEGLAFLHQHTVDILFLDIKMDELTGIELLESMPPDRLPQVIITTAYQQYALKGYELNVTDYLLKPFTYQRFLQAANKAHQVRKFKQQPSSFIFVKSEHRLLKVFLDDIRFIEGMRDYRRLHLADQRIMTLQTFGHFEQLIPKAQVCRIHKSYMVAISKIDAIEKNHVKIGDKQLPISATYREAFFKIIESQS